MDNFKKKGDVSLWVAIAAILIVVIAVVFFYREIQKIKRETFQIKTIRNQLSNIDTRLDVIDSGLESNEAVYARFKSIASEPSRPPVRDPPQIVEIKKTLVLEEPESSEEESDDEDSDEDSDEEITEVIKKK
jgi:hypothetical protein